MQILPVTSSSLDTMNVYGPWVMQDTDTKREWLFPETPRYYVHRESATKWVIMDRLQDEVVGQRHSTRTEAIQSFYQFIGRPVPEHADLPAFTGSNFEGV